MRTRTAGIVLAAAFSLTGCNQLWSGVTERVIGNGQVVTSSRQLGEFDKIELEGSYDVTLTQEHSSTIRIEADSNILSHLTTDVNGKNLVVSSEADLQPSKRIHLYISSDRFREIAIDGSADVRSTTPLASDDLTLGLEGSGTYDLEVHTKALHSSIAGSGKITLRGDAGRHDVSISGSGDLFAFGLSAESTDISISGSGNANLNSSRTIDATISGSGNVRYKGTAQDLHTSIAGSGKVEKVAE